MGRASRSGSISRRPAAAGADRIDAAGDDPGDLAARVSGEPADAETLRDLEFAWRALPLGEVATRSCSRKDGAAVGVGMGQVNRVDSAGSRSSGPGTARARRRSRRPTRSSRSPTGSQVLIDAGVRAVVQPGGSVRDEEVIEAAPRGRRDDVLHRDAPLLPLSRAPRGAHHGRGDGTDHAATTTPRCGRIALAFLVGVLAAAQSRINGQLAIEVHDGLLAAVISFGTGLIVVLGHRAGDAGHRVGLCCTTCPSTSGAVTCRGGSLIGGLLGATFVAGQGSSCRCSAVALFTVLAVAGSTVSSMLTDRAGIGPGGRRPVTVRRVVAAVGTSVAVGLAVSGRVAVGDLVLWALVLAVVAGGMTGVQPALNGQVGGEDGRAARGDRDELRRRHTALLVALGIEHALGHAWTAPPPRGTRPALWLGGPGRRGVRPHRRHRRCGRSACCCSAC